MSKITQLKKKWYGTSTYDRSLRSFWLIKVYFQQFLLDEVSKPSCAVDDAQECPTFSSSALRIIRVYIHQQNEYFVYDFPNASISREDFKLCILCVNAFYVELNFSHIKRIKH